MKKSKVLVTGADGFIGSHLVEHLVRQGHEVKALVLYNSFNSWGWLDDSPTDIKKSIEVIASDIRDPYGMKEALKGCDTVYHLAALIAIPYSYHNPASYIETNVHGTLNVLQAARDNNVKVVHTSTSEVYGTAQFVPITEEHPLIGQSPYSASKIGADQIAYSFYSSFQLPVVTLRPFNTYGPRQSNRAVIPTIISQLAVTNDISLGALSTTRDFNYVEDTVRAFEAAGHSEAAIGQTINAGSSYEISIKDTAKLIAKIMGKNLTVKVDNARLRPEKSEVERLWACNKKAKELLNWTPIFAGVDGFEKGIKKTVEWFLNPENLKKYKADKYNI